MEEPLHFTESYKKLLHDQQDLFQKIEKIELKTSITMFLFVLTGTSLFVMFITDILKFQLTT